MDPAVIAKVIAGIVALLAAYGSKADGFRSFLKKFTTKASQAKSDELNKDVAWRELMDDSRNRNCPDSVALLIKWMELRTKHGLQKEK